ncbi:MAG TPA: hypothetical protein PKL83_02860 [bacterium]|nr:hypothetical protein [bacterium]
MTTQVQQVQRKESLALAIILSLGLLVYTTSDAQLAIWLAVPMFVIPLLGSLWVLKLPFPPDPKRLELYALLIQPVLLYSGTAYFLRQASSPLLPVVGFFGMIVFYLLFISLSALELYRRLPNHVGRIILNVFSLVTGYIYYSYLFQLDVHLALGVGIAFIVSFLLFFQSIFWWSSAHISYSVLYACLAAFLLSMLFFCLFFWPLGYLVTGFVMLIGQYFLTGIIQQYFKKNLTRAVVIEHAVVSLGMLAIILLQVRWLPSL